MKQSNEDKLFFFEEELTEGSTTERTSTRQTDQSDYNEDKVYTWKQSYKLQPQRRRSILLATNQDSVRPEGLTFINTTSECQSTLLP